MRCRSLISFGVAIALSSAVVAQETCEAIVETALQTIAGACAETGRNQVCYGNLQLQAEGRGADFAFENVGDIVPVENLETLSLSPLDPIADVWGAALFSLQANLPDSVPGQNVILLALGDVNLTNTVPTAVTLPASATANARIRREPDSTTDNVIIVLNSGSRMTVDGRTEDGQWVRVQLERGQNAATLGLGESPAGWASRQVVSVQGNVMDLPVLNASQSPQRPMQSYILRSGIGASTCADAPPDGLLIQSPAGNYRVTLNVNGVDIGLGSTAFLQTTDGALALTLLEGTGFVEADGQQQLVPPGTQVRVPLTPDLTAPAGPPSAPQPAEIVVTRAVQAILAQVAPSTPPDEGTATLYPATIAEPLAEEAIEEAVTEALNAFGFLPGMWRITVTRILTHRDEWGPQFGVNICQVGRGAQQGSSNIIHINWEANLYIGGGVYGEPLSEHARVRGLQLPVGGGDSAWSVIIESPTRGRGIYTDNVHISTEGRQDDARPGVSICEFQYEYVFLGN